MFRFTNKYKKLPLTTESLEEVAIGSWWHYQKSKIMDKNDKLYIVMSENVYVKNGLDKYLEKTNKKK